METPTYELTVNGAAHVVEGTWLGESLLAVLRDHLGLYGAKNACEQGECGSCSVLVDGVVVCACLELAAACQGCDITTVEGLGAGGLTDVQRAFVDHGAVQCGFCTPGLVVAAHELLARRASPSELEVREALAGNLCRCTGYGRIVAAVQAAASARGGASGRGEGGGPRG